MKQVWACLKKYYEVIGYGVLTLLLLGACFMPAFAWIAAVYALVFAGVLHHESKIFALMLYLHCFFALFNYQNLWGITLDIVIAGVLIFAIFILYVYRVIKREYKVNWKTLIPIGLFLVYLVLPFHQCYWQDFFAEVFFFVLIYIIFEERKALDFRSIVRVLVLGLLVSCAFALLRKVSPLLEDKIRIWDYYGIFRFNGLTFHPNTLYPLIVVAISGMLILFYKNKISMIELIASYVLLFGFGYFTLSRAFLVTSITAVVVFTIVYFVKARGKAILLGGLMLALMCLVGGVFYGTTKAYFNRISQSTDLVVISHAVNGLTIQGLEDCFDNQPEEWKQAVWAGEIHFDPGRPGLRGLYLRDWSSSPKNVFLGCGISRPQIGQMSAHNLLIQELWKHGLVGYCFYLAMIIGGVNWCRFKQRFKVYLPLLIVLIPYFLITMVEQCLLDYIRVGVILAAVGFLEKIAEEKAPKQLSSHSMDKITDKSNHN